MRWLGFSSALVLLAWVAPVQAEDPAAAEALFREARALFAEGKTDAACQKFKASQALEASPGTLLNLAACHRAQGKSATAWAEFVAAARLARAQRKERQEAEASQRAAELEPTLNYLTVRVAEPVPGLEVRRDGALLEPSVYGVRVPVDPGSYRIVASAPGYEPVRLEVVISSGRTDEHLEIPRLRRQAESAGPAAESPRSAQQLSSASPSSGRQSAVPPGADSGRTSTLPFVIAGVGGAFLVTGTVAGVMALKSNGSARELCPVASDCNDAGARSNAERRDTEALIANIGVGAGLFGVGVAAYLLLTAKSDAPAARALIPTITRSAAALTLVEQF